MRFPACLLLAFLSAACSHGQKTTTDAASYPADLSVTIAEGGGFTGQWEGFEVDSAGSITRLSGRPPGFDRTPAGRLSPGKMNILWTRIETSGILSGIPSDRSGNMTRSIAITANGARTRSSWPPSFHGGNPEDSLFVFIRAFVSAETSRN